MAIFGQFKLLGLQIDNVVPLVTSRPLRTMLEHEAVLGWQFLTGVKVPLPLFKALAPCKSKEAVIDAYKKFTCVDSPGNSRPEWYTRLESTKGECPVPWLLIKGDFATDSELAINLCYRWRRPASKCSRMTMRCRPL